jgi:integrase
MGKRLVTKYQGVYERTAENRKHQGKPDICYDISYKVDGKKMWEKAGWASEGYTAKLAAQIRAERIRNIRHGEDLPKQKATAPLFKDLADKYLKWAAENRTRAGKDDERRYKSYLAPRFDARRLDEISPLDLERVKSDLTKKGLAPASVKHVLVVFRQMVNKAIAWGLYDGRNPIYGVKMPFIQNERQRFLLFEEADALLKHLKEKSSNLHDMALLSLHCGLRAGEIFDLKKQDLDFDNNLITVTNPQNKGSRMADMTKEVSMMLLNRRPDAPDDLVFKNRSGKQIRWVSQSFRRIIHQLGFNKGVTDRRQLVTFHTLRHTFASWLAMQGETQLTIADMLGHKDLKMTRRYAHLIQDHKRRAALNLEKAFQENRKKTHELPRTGKAIHKPRPR